MSETLTEVEEPPRRPSKRKYKGTRDLIRRAQNAGYTQDDLAKIMRVSQSMISRWANGEGLAKQHQADLLLALFGSPGNRTRSTLYAVVEPDPAIQWPHDESEPPPPPVVPRWRSVAGEIIFRHTMHIHYVEGVNRRRRLRAVPVGRLVVHRGKRGQLLLVSQQPARLMGWHAIWNDLVKNDGGDSVRGPDSQSGWYSQIDGPLEVGVLMRRVEELLAPRWEAYDRTEDDEDDSPAGQWMPPPAVGPSDAVTIPFRLRQALLDAGYPVEDVEPVEGFE